jgi:hypothetical protein
MNATSTTIIAFDGNTLAAIVDWHQPRGLDRRCDVRTLGSHPTAGGNVAVASYGTPRIAAAMDVWLRKVIGVPTRRSGDLGRGGEGAELPTYDSGAEQYAAIFVCSTGAYTVLPASREFREPLISRLVISERVAQPTIWGFVPNFHADDLPVGLKALATVKTIYGCLPKYSGTIQSADTSDLWEGFGEEDTA